MLSRVFNDDAEGSRSTNSPVQGISTFPAPVKLFLFFSVHVFIDKLIPSRNMCVESGMLSECNSRAVVS